MEGDATQVSYDEAEISRLRKRVRELNKELEDYESSFELYHKASQSLMAGYKLAHPEFPKEGWPDTSKVNQWAAQRIIELEAALKEINERIGRILLLPE